MQSNFQCCGCCSLNDQRTFSEWQEHIEHLLDENLIGLDELQFSKFNVEATKFMLIKNVFDPRFIQNVKKCLFDNEGFNIQKPKFLFSITGRTKDLSVSTSFQEAFKSALIDVSAKTNTLITTGGLDLGVGRLVGEAVDIDQPIIGIASWRKSKLQHNDHALDYKETFLDNLRRRKPDLERENRDLFQRRNENNLNSKHSCFIFVDNDHTGQLRGEMKFRAELEHSVAEELKIPLILVVLQGGIGTLETICHMIEKKHPVLLIDKSKGCTELIKDLLKNKNDKNIVKKLMNEEKYQRLVNTLEKKQNTEEYLSYILRSHYEYINILEITGKETGEQISESIFKALTAVDSHLNELNMKYKISLAITWNLIEKGQDYLEMFLEDAFNRNYLNDLFKQALLENKWEFLDLFLRNKFNLKEFLTKETLLDLYNNEMRNLKRQYNEPFSFYLHKKKLVTYDGEIKLKNISDFLKQIFDTLDTNSRSSFLPNEYDIDAYQVKNPLLNLFIWCVLSNRIESAKLLWKLGNNQICNALIASKILKHYSKIFYENKTWFLNRSNEFEQLAVYILDEFQENNRNLVHDVLVIRYMEFIRMDCLQLAVEADCKSFISHNIVQNALKKIWKGEEVSNWMSDNLSKHEKSLLRCQHEYNQTRQYVFSNHYLASKYRNPIIRTILSPRTKFLFHTVSYITFLVLFSTIMLVKDPFVNKYGLKSNSSNSVHETPSQDDKMRVFSGETICLLWIITFLFDEIRQIFFNNYPKFSFKIKLLKYMKQGWSIFGLVTCILFIVGYVLIHVDDIDYNNWGELFNCIALTMWYTRGLKICMVLEKLGTKIIIMRKMFKELVYFFIIILIMMTGFSVGLQALIDPVENNTFAIINNLIYKLYCYFCHDQILFKENRSYFYQTKDDISYTMLVVYSIISGEILLNFIISVLMTIYGRIEHDIGVEWKNQMHKIVLDYNDYPLLPPPLNVLTYFFCIFNQIRYCFEKNKDAFKDEEDVLKEAERTCSKKCRLVTM